MSNGSIWPCEGSGLARISGWPDICSVDFAAYQPLRRQHSPVISCLDSNRGLPPF